MRTVPFVALVYAVATAVLAAFRLMDDRHAPRRVVAYAEANANAAPCDSARVLALEAMRAADRGALNTWSAPHRTRLRQAPHDVAALYAVASAERLAYRYDRADSLYARVIARPTVDGFSRQSTLWRVVMRSIRGRQNGLSDQLSGLERAALAAGDTLTALDAILANAGVVLRAESANAATAVLARGDALRWTRAPDLDAGAKCRTAAIHSRLGERDLARRLAREGESIAMRARLQRLAASCLFTLATDFVRSGLSDSLQRSLQRVITIQKQTGDLAGLAASSQWAGYYTMTLGHFSFAQQYLAQAWESSQRAGLVGVAAWTALNRASMAIMFFDAPATATWVARADSLMRAVDDPQGVIEVARLLARRASIAGDAEGSRRQLLLAQTLADRLGEPSTRLSVLASLRELELREGRLSQAANYLRAEGEVIARYEMSGWKNSLVANEAELALRRGDAKSALPLIDRVLASLHPTQHRYLHATRVQRALALALLGETRASAAVAKSAAAAFDAWRESLSDSTLRLLTVQAQRGNGWYASSLIARLAEGGETETAFELLERQKARELHDRMLLARSWSHSASMMRPFTRDSADFSVPRLRQLLPDGRSAIVTLDLGEGGSEGTAFVLTSLSLTAHRLPSVDELAPRIRRLVALLESGRSAEGEAAALGAALFGPIAGTLDSAGIARLSIVPEGVLHRVPFDVLRLPDGRVALERFEISVAPSAAVLGRLRMTPHTASTPVRVLAMADASVRPMATGATAGDSSIGTWLLSALLGDRRRSQRLVGARDEVQRVRQAIPTTDVRMGALARESDFKQLASRFDILHLATHAVVDEWSGASAAMLLTSGAGDNGALESFEISALRLRASLVVLSACRTVGGEVIAGEGVRGLTSAFLQAGARTVVATSWRVDDRTIVPLMGDFYREIARGEMVGSALTTARRAAMRRGAPPSVWGAFTLVGDPWHRIVDRQPSPARTR